MNQFLVQAAYEKARLIIEQDRIIKMSAADSENFFQIVDNPPEPSEKLIESIKTYKAMVAQC